MQGIQGIMDAQEDAWNEGDINEFMSHYHPQVCFLGKTDQTCGREEVTANYLRSYPDRDAMGKLEFDNWEIHVFDARNAWVSGTWTLFRENDNLHGRYSLLWRFEDEGWLILRDHSDLACE